MTNPTITQGALLLLKTQVMADVPEGGGAVTGDVIADGGSNTIFPDISDIDRAIGVNAMMEHPDTPLIVRLASADALEFRRHSPTVLALSGALGMSSAQLDALFISSAQIEA